MDRRTFIKSLAALSALPLVEGCQPRQPLVLSIHPWVGYEPINLARDFHWMPQGVQFLDVRSAQESIDALKHGQSDAACLTLDEMLGARALGLPLCAVLVFDVSVGADVVLARQDIRSLADLAGKRIGVEFNGVGDLVLDRLMEVAGIAPSRISLIDIPIDRQLGAWRRGTVDAMVSYQPVASQLLREGARRVFDSRQMPDTIFDVLAVNVARVDLHRDELEGLITGYFRGLNHLQSSRDDARYRIAARQRIGIDEVRLALAGISQPTLEANREYLSDRAGRLNDAARRIVTLQARRSGEADVPSLEGLLSAGWLPHELG